MTRDAVIDKVMAKLDELTPFDEALVISSGNDGVMPLREYIESILNETTRDHLKNCPLKWITSVNIGSITPTAPTTVLLMTKPSDYVKIHTVKSTTWTRALQSVITPDDPKYKLQQNTYTKGTINKPVLVDLGPTLEAYSVTNGVATATCTYVKYLVPESITDDNTVDMITTLAAYKVLSIMRELEHSKVMFEIYKLQMNA